MERRYFVTTNTLQLADAVLVDTDDTLVREAVKEKFDEISKALAKGDTYVLRTHRGDITISPKDPAKVA
jgi:hypothetical protein